MVLLWHHLVASECQGDLFKGVEKLHLDKSSVLAAFSNYGTAYIHFERFIIKPEGDTHEPIYILQQIRQIMKN